MLIKTFACNGIIIIFLLYSNEMKWMRMHSLRNEAFVNITYIMNVLSAFNLHVWFNLWSILNNFSLDSFEQKNPLLFLHSSVFPHLFFCKRIRKKNKTINEFCRQFSQPSTTWKIKWLKSASIVAGINSRACLSAIRICWFFPVFYPIKSDFILCC